MLRGAVIGYGFISGKGHAPAYLTRSEEEKDVEIVAVADICEKRRILAKSALPEARIYESHETLLEKESAQLDFVDISTPPCDHAAIAHAAFDRGLHVLCEKPLTTTLEDAQSLLDHAIKAKKVLFPCHNYKHAPVVKAVSEMIKSGRIGNVHSLTLQTFRNTHAKGVPEWKTDWRREKKISGGGIAMDHGSHSFYLTFDWLGSYPTALTAKMSISEPDKWDTEDNFSSVLSFPNGTATMYLTWTAGVRKVIYTIQGDKGALTIDDDEMQIALMQPVSKGKTTWKNEKHSISSDWMDASHVGWFNSLFDEFKRSIGKKEFVGKDAKEALLCIQLITKAYESANNQCKEIPL